MISLSLSLFSPTFPLPSVILSPSHRLLLLLSPPVKVFLCCGSSGTRTSYLRNFYLPIILVIRSYGEANITTADKRKRFEITTGDGASGVRCAK